MQSACCDKIIDNLSELAERELHNQCASDYHFKLVYLSPDINLPCMLSLSVHIHKYNKSKFQQTDFQIKYE